MEMISVCIPTYEMNGRGATFLKQSFNILNDQTFKAFDIVISDHSKDSSIKNLCDEYAHKLNIKYYRNEEKRGSSSANINNAINKAEGRLIKILFQDDFLYSRDSLREIADSFDTEKDNWLVTACARTNDGKDIWGNFFPKYNRLIQFGHNTISSPSVLTIKNNYPLSFDENLLWLMDCDYYKRCHDKFGLPKIINKINVVNRIGEHQVSNTRVKILTKIKEWFYVVKKYNF